MTALAVDPERETVRRLGGACFGGHEVHGAGAGAETEAEEDVISTVLSDAPSEAPVPSASLAFTGGRHSSDTELLPAATSRSRTSLAHATPIDGDELADAVGLADAVSDAPPEGSLPDELGDALGIGLAEIEPDIRGDGLDDGLAESWTTPVLVDASSGLSGSSMTSARPEGEGLVADAGPGWQTGGSSTPSPTAAPALVAVALIT